MQNPALKHHVDYATRLSQWQKVRDTIEGQDAVKLAGLTYLPKPSAQTVQAYSAYKQRASFYACPERTLRGLTGMVFRSDPAVTVPPGLEPRLESATPEGYSFDVWAQEAISEVLSVGRYGILVDYPQGEVPAGTAPYFSPYFAEDIRNWHVCSKNGQKVLTRVVLTENTDSQVSDDVERVLELYLDEATGIYTVQRWESDKISKAAKASGTWRMVDAAFTPVVNGKALDYIPFVFVSPYNLRPDVSKPPMLDLANMAIDHYQNSADYEHALYLTAQPTPWISGKLDEAKKPKSIGSATIWYLPEGSQAGMLEFTGAGLEAQRKAMEDKESRMAVLGARLINDSNIGANIAAETVRLTSRSDTSVLTSSTRMVAEAFTKAFKIAAEWMGASTEQIEVVLNTDFVETRLDFNDLNALVKSWQVGAISRSTLHENLQRGEIVKPDKTVEEEVAEIERDGVGLGLIPAPAVAPTTSSGGTNDKPSGSGNKEESQGGAASNGAKPGNAPKPGNGA